MNLGKMLKNASAYVYLVCRAHTHHALLYWYRQQCGQRGLNPVGRYQVHPTGPKQCYSWQRNVTGKGFSSTESSGRGQTAGKGPALPCQSLALTRVATHRSVDSACFSLWHVGTHFKHAAARGVHCRCWLCPHFRCCNFSGDTYASDRHSPVAVVSPSISPRGSS